MTTSPDESRPSGVSAIVVPDVLRPRVDEFLRSLGCTIEEFPWEASPVPMVIAMPKDPDVERKSRYAETIDLGRSTSPVDMGVIGADPNDTRDLWTPMSNVPGLRPLPDPRALPAYRATRSDDPDRAPLACTRCEHGTAEHDGYAYRAPFGFSQPPMVTVAVCLVGECACLTHVEPPTPV